MTFDEILTHFSGVRRNGKGYLAWCPVHEADGPATHRSKSLSINEGRDQPVVLSCLSQHCAFTAILDAAGLTVADVSTPRFTVVPPSASVTPRTGLIAEYFYHDEQGTILFSVRRFEPKAFRQGHLVGGRWVPHLEGVRRHVLYRLKQLQKESIIWIVEGEQKADTLAALGFAATCNAGGAGKWTPEHTTQLRATGATHVFLLADNDEVGRAHVQKIIGLLGDLPYTVLELPDLPPKGDVVDWLAAGHTSTELGILAEQARQRGTGLDPIYLTDGPIVVAEGQRIAVEGIPYVVEGLIPAYGMLGMCVAYAKVGKTTFGQQLAAAVATGQLFLDRPTRQVRVLILASEDPPEFTAHLARHLLLPPNVLTFYRGPLRLDADGLRRIAATIQAGQYGLVLIASWQAVVRGLVKDENDNAGSVRVVEDVKATVRTTGMPWLIDAHAGKGEDQSDDADPSKAMRGASGAAGAVDFTLHLRYANGTFGSQRRLSGKGRFVDVAPLLLDYDREMGTYTVIGTTKDAATETTWRLLCETGAITATPQDVTTIALAAGLAREGHKAEIMAARRRVIDALHGRAGVTQQIVASTSRRRIFYSFTSDTKEGGWL